MVLKTSDMIGLYVEARAKFNKIDIGIPESTGCLVCRRRQLADDTEGGKTSAHEMPEELFGNLLKRTGWQPMLAKAEVSAFPPRSAEDG